MSQEEPLELGSGDAGSERDELPNALDNDIERTPVRIGTLYFKYEQPEIGVTTESRTVEHETINDTIVVQQLGRRADQITINAIVSDLEVWLVDVLTQAGVVSLRSDRWSGKVLVKSTDTTFMRAVDDDNTWLHRATITCLEVDETM